MKKWIEQEADKSSVDLLKKENDIAPILARLLVQRGIIDPVLADEFLNPKLKDLKNPLEIKNLELAVSRIIAARNKKQNILLVGDYDVDGISSTVMLQQALESIDISVQTIIPKRLSEGYGLTLKALKRGLGIQDFSLVVALDCGTNSIQEADFLKDNGIDLIIVDHHQLKTEVLPDAILVNPHLQKCEGEPWRNLCTAGLCFKLIHGLFIKARALELPGSEALTPRDFIPLCAIGTLADLVPLNGENRILSRFGIKRLFIDASPGLLALLKECGLDGTFEPETEDITYKLAPRINACGRLNEPETAVSLLLEDDPKECDKLAQKLTLFNEKRKKIETQLTADALSQARETFSDKPAVVATGEGTAWHPGVVGIVAGKLSNTLNKPCLVLAKLTDKEYVGSGRGVPGVNLVEVLSCCQENLTHWGGHPVAVGLGVEEHQLGNFIEQFLKTVSKISDSNEQLPLLTIDAFIKKEHLNYRLMDQINKLGPFGQNNPEPILGVKKVILDSSPKMIGNGEHFQFSFNNSTEYVRGVAWRMGNNVPPKSKELDFAFRLRKNYWNGRTSLQLVLEDWRFSDSN